MPLPNFFNSYFYGKSGKKDFTQADLPANRLQLFREVFSVRRGSMVGLNLLYLLCWIPAIFWAFLNLIQLYQADPSYSRSLDAILYSWLLVLAPLVTLTGPFNMGISRVLRTWARDEHSFALSDFAAGLKENWKQGLLFGAINGLVPLTAYICANFYLSMAAGFPLFFVPLAVTLIAALVWFLAAPILPVLIVSYDLPFPVQLKNALLMTLAEFPRAILIRTATLAVPALLLVLAAIVPSALGLATGAAVVLYAVILLAFNKLIDASFANYLGEKYLNPKIEGARTGIGLRPKEEE